MKEAIPPITTDAEQMEVLAKKTTVHQAVPVLVTKVPFGAPMCSIFLWIYWKQIYYTASTRAYVNVNVHMHMYEYIHV